MVTRHIIHPHSYLAISLLTLNTYSHFRAANLTLLLFILVSQRTICPYLPTANRLASISSNNLLLFKFSWGQLALSPIFLLTFHPYSNLVAVNASSLQFPSYNCIRPSFPDSRLNVTPISCIKTAPDIRHSYLVIAPDIRQLSRYCT